MSICATIGKPIIIDAPACIHDGFVVFRFLPEDVDTEFLFYQLLKNEEKFRSLKQTGTQGNLNTSLVGETYISLPPFKEQRAIVGVLSLIDSAIELTDQVIVKTEQLKRGLMQQLLTHGIGHTEYKNTSIGLLPEEWSVVPCSEVCREITVGIVVTPAKYYVRSGVPCLRSFNVKENEIEPRDLVYISKESNEFHKKSIIHSGEIVAVRTGKTGVASVVPQSFDGANCVDLIIMRPNGTVEANFLSWFLNSNVVKTQVRAGETGSVQKHFNIEMVKKLAIALPSIPEQKRISAILSTLNEKLKIEQKEKAQLEKIKSGIMDLLLSGNVRIKVD
jgi:type I restriction enzyme S subunit